jgi:hypothetical protein
MLVAHLEPMGEILLQGILGIAVAGLLGYLAYAVTTYISYGDRSRHLPPESEGNPLLDRFMPDYDVRDHHATRVEASADQTMWAAREAKWQDSWFARSKIGWEILAEVPGREVVMGAITQPWVKNPTFRKVSPERFASFREPGYVKIVWTIKSLPQGPSRTLLSTETRLVPTDDSARIKFRPYWTFLSPGIIVIRWILLRSARRKAEGRHLKMWGAVSMLMLISLSAFADVPECGDGSRAFVDVAAHELTALAPDGAAVTRELPVCAFLKIHTNICLLGMCFGADRKVRIPARFVESTGRYVIEATRVELRKHWVPRNPDCWEMADYEIYEINVGKGAHPGLDGGRAYLSPGDPAFAKNVVLNTTREDLFGVCK